MAEGEQRVTPLELFFDLVFVFAFTQVTGLMSADPSWQGLGRGLLVLAALWWAWAAYAWLTNMLEPEAVGVRVAMVSAMAAMLVVALAVPQAFGEDGVLFGVAYLVVRVLNVVLIKLAGRDDPDLLGAILRVVPWATVAPVLLVAAGFLDGEAQAALWVVALALDYFGALMGRGQGWRVSPAHFAERHGLIVIIALGESIVAIGIGAAGLAVDLKVIAAAVLGIAVVAALWWAYFDVFALYAQRKLEDTRGEARASLARDYYSYLHLPLVAGIVLFALGLKKALEHVADPLDAVPALALSGGLGLYFLTHVAWRLRLARSLGRGRPVTAVVLLAVTPAVTEIPALAALALVAVVCGSLVVYDLVHYRDERRVAREARWEPGRIVLPSSSAPEATE
jgi:low temperature requirement protein LtrA